MIGPLIMFCFLIGLGVIVQTGTLSLLGHLLQLMAVLIHGNVLMAILVGAGAVALPGLVVVAGITMTLACYRRYVLGPTGAVNLSVDGVRSRILTVLYERNLRGTASRFQHMGRLTDDVAVPRRPVARWLGSPYPAVSRAVEYLVEKGLVERDTEDRAYVRITALGQDVVEHPQHFRQDPAVRSTAIYISGGVGEIVVGTARRTADRSVRSAHRPRRTT